MVGWVDAKAVIRIAYRNKNLPNFAVISTGIFPVPKRDRHFDYWCGVVGDRDGQALAAVDAVASAAGLWVHVLDVVLVQAQLMTLPHV